MNSIRRAIIAERNRLFTLSPTSILQKQNASSSSTTTTNRNTLRTLKSSKTRPPAEVRSQPPTASPPLPVVVQKEPPVTTNWPKPSEIPWQAKVVNSVNLIGQVKIPVQFEASSDGKNWAGTIISLEDGSDSSPSLPSFWIPVIFEGDLAHIAMCHLKEKDYVHVAGHLSVDVPPFKLSEVQANVQVMVHSINFVQGSQSKNISTPELDKWTTKNAATPKNNVFAQQSLKEPNLMSEQPSTSSKVTAYEENYGESPNSPESSPVRNSKEVRRSYSDGKADRQNIRASWRDLLINSKQWVDNRENKRKGVVKPKYPDFKHKDTGVGLWLDNAPAEVLRGLGQLEFFSKGEKDGDSWKDLIENPNKWWDNRVDKRNQKAPDFKHKDSGKGLWLGDAPAWALSRFPKPKTVDVDMKKAWGS